MNWRDPRFKADPAAERAWLQRQVKEVVESRMPMAKTLQRGDNLLLIRNWTLDNRVAAVKHSFHDLRGAIERINGEFAKIITETRKPKAKKHVKPKTES